MRNIIFLSITLTFSQSSLAGTQAFGGELNVTTTGSMEKEIDAREVGLSAITNGKIYELSSNPFGVEGLKKVIYVFNKDGRLVGIQAELDKYSFENVNKALAKKYKVIESRVPYVGDKFVRYRTSDGAIALNAPHMSFVMQVTYLTQSFEKAVKAYNQTEENNKRRNEQSAF